MLFYGFQWEEEEDRGGKSKVRKLFCSVFDKMTMLARIVVWVGTTETFLYQFLGLNTRCVCVCVCVGEGMYRILKLQNTFVCVGKIKFSAYVCGTK